MLNVILEGGAMAGGNKSEGTDYRNGTAHVPRKRRVANSKGPTSV